MAALRAYNSETPAASALSQTYAETTAQAWTTIRGQNTQPRVDAALTAMRLRSYMSWGVIAMLCLILAWSVVRLPDPRRDDDGASDHGDIGPVGNSVGPRGAAYVASESDEAHEADEVCRSLISASLDLFVPVAAGTAVFYTLYKVNSGQVRAYVLLGLGVAGPCTSCTLKGPFSSCPCGLSGGSRAPGARPAGGREELLGELGQVCRDFRIFGEHPPRTTRLTGVARRGGPTSHRGRSGSSPSPARRSAY